MYSRKPTETQNLRPAPPPIWSRGSGEQARFGGGHVNAIWFVRLFETVLTMIGLRLVVSSIG